MDPSCFWRTGKEDEWDIGGSCKQVPLHHHEARRNARYDLLEHKACPFPTSREGDDYAHPLPPS